MTPTRRPASGTLSLVISVLALLIAMSGTAYAALADGSVRTRHLANRAVTNAKIATGAVTSDKIAAGAVAGSDLRADAVTGPKVKDGSLGLGDLGGMLTDQTTTIASAVPIAANTCRPLGLRLFNPAPAGLVGSMVVGTIVSSTGGAVVNNTGAISPTLVTETSQGGAFIHLLVCAGGSAQTIPVNAVATWSVIRP